MRGPATSGGNPVEHSFAHPCKCAVFEPFASVCLRKSSYLGSRSSPGLLACRNHNSAHLVPGRWLTVFSGPLSLKASGVPGTLLSKNMVNKSLSNFCRHFAAQAPDENLLSNIIPVLKKSSVNYMEVRNKMNVKYLKFYRYLSL